MSDKSTRTAPARRNESSGQRLLTGFVAIAIAALLVLACSAQQVQKQSNADAASPVNSGATTDADRTSALPKDLPLRILSDVPLTGGFDERGRNLEKVGEGFFAPNAHSVAVDSRTPCVYFPLQNVGGKPVLRIALPSDKQL